MASREVTRQGQVEWQPARPPPGDDIWQGWEVNRTPNSGIEITLRTSKPSHALWWIGLTVAVMGVVIVAAAVPDAGTRDPNYPRGFVVIFVSVLLLAAVGVAMIALAAMLPEEWSRTFALETIEVRPEGLTINQSSFFSRDEVFTFSVTPEKGASGEYCYACQGIIGTRQLVLLRGLDKPTASVLEATLEQAKRLKWSEPEFDD